MKTILIIDSCAITRECLSAILRAKGYRVQCASLISQAKAMIAKRPPQLMITEIRLPDDNSLNLMRSLKAEPNFSKIKICLLTQAVSKKPIMEAVELGVCKVILKSNFTIASFLEQLDSVFNINQSNNTSANGATSEGESPVPADLRYPLPTPGIDPSIELKNVKPLVSRSQLKEQLDELDELETMSDSIAQILKQIDDPESPLEQVAQLIKLDQAIAMKVMRTVNSIEYSRGEQTSRLRDAVVRIGLEELRTLVVGFKVIDPNHCGIDQRQFWDHAIATAVCTSKIAELCTDIDPEFAFTAAILHDIGRVMLQQALPKEYKEVLEVSQTQGIALELVEKRMLLADHTSIAQTTLHTWDLPKELVEAISSHHCPPNKLPSVNPKNTKLSAAVELGNRLAHTMRLGSSGNQTISPTEELFEILETPELNIESVTLGIKKQVEDLKALISPPSKDKDQLINHADTPVFDKSFNPLYITMDPETDALGQWITGLLDGEADAQPNIIVLHVRLPKDRAELGKKLIEAVSKLKLNTTDTALPVLILSPTGKLAPADDIISKHPSMHLMTPFSMLHFEESVNHLLNGQIHALPASSARKAA